MFRHKCIRNIRTFKLQHNVRSTDPWFHDNIEITNCGAFPYDRKYETLCIQQNIVKAQNRKRINNN